MSPAAIPALISALVTAVVSAVASTTISLLSQAIMGKKSSQSQRRESQDTRQRQNLTSTIAGLPVVYGKARVGGLRVFAETKIAYESTETVSSNGTSYTQNTRGDYLYAVTALCEGEIDDIEQVLIDGIDANDARFKSPQKVDITLEWDFTEPNDIELVRAVEFQPQNGQYYNIYNKEYYGTPYAKWAGGWYGMNGGYGILPTTVQEKYKPDRYAIYRQNLDIQGSSNTLILKSVGGIKGIALQNSDYGNYKYTVEYIRDDGLQIRVGSASVHIDTDNNDFAYISRDALNVSQNSYQDGEYIKSSYRLGGSDNSTAIDFLTSELTGYEANRLGTGIAYMAHRLLKHTAGQKASDTEIKRVPEITAIVKGKVVYDPRDNMHKWSDNPALCILDYLTNSVYGFGLDMSEIDIDSFVNEANYCDETVSNPDGTSKRYTLNGVVNTENKLIDNLKELLTSCNGQILWSINEWKLAIDKAQEAVMTIGETVIVGNMDIKRGSLSSRQNTIKAKYLKPELGYQFDVLDIVSNDYKAIDNNKTYSLERELLFTSSLNEAFRLSVLDLKRSRLDLSIKFKTIISSYALQAGDVVAINYDIFGWSAKKFRITSQILDADGLLEYEAVEYDSNIYDTSDFELASSYQDSSMTSPFEALPPENISYTQSYINDSNNNYINSVLLEWDNALSINTMSYKIELKPHGFGDWQVLGYSNDSAYTINSLTAGEYELRIKTINSLGYNSIYAYKNIVVNNATDAPLQITKFYQTASNASSLSLEWERPARLGNNGYYLIKHWHEKTGVIWNSVENARWIVPSSQNSLTIPRIDGTYMIKAVNSAGITAEQEAVLVIDSNINLTLLDTLICETAWLGDKQNCWVDADKLKLAYLDALLWDSINIDWDTIATDWDNGVLPNAKYPNTASYQPSDILDLLTPQNIRLVKHITANLIENLQNWDDITGNWDDITGNWDGGNTDEIMIAVYYCTTTDDPSSSSAVWSDYRLLTQNDEYARGVKIKVEIVKQKVETQLEISSLQVEAYQI